MTFEQYLDEQGAWLPRFARVLCGQRELSEDVLQEVLLRAHGQWHRIGAMEHPSAYLRRMLVNEHLSWSRRAARQQLRSEVGSLESSPDLAVHSTNRAQVTALLRTLPPRQRAAVVLRYYSGLSDAEIADALGCSGGTVRSHLSRALATMRIDLAAQSLESQKG